MNRAPRSQPAPVEDDQDDEPSPYARLMTQGPTASDHRGRLRGRHVVNGRGIR
ncbi:hypothetical protein [Streptomyces sp. 3211]|uniref:hypothetical protein n=1 Tax=Streptomyces sp. 3211 TaxID=1964449 RepID=UPI001331ADEB|nr:hypothetical protein [Streptomyces sp. 3211]